jgi:hypothetical protein
MRIDRRIWIIGLAAVTACGPAQDADDTAADAGAETADMPDHATGDMLTDDDRASIARVAGAVEAFRDVEAAKAAGYTEQYPAGCAFSAEGAQGIHYMNPALVDGRVELLTPELVMYEPQADGSMVFVGVDYAIPFDQWQNPEPPTILGRPLMRNEALSVWALHIWSPRVNPSGTFAVWNPAVTCEHAKMVP